MHVDDIVLAPVRERFGTPAILTWDGEITDAEWAIATYNPSRTHDVTLFILDPSRRLALIRKPPFPEDVWRPPGGGIKRNEDFVAGSVREALEETGLRVELRRYLVASEAVFRNAGRELQWRTHVFLAETRTRSSRRTIPPRSPPPAGERRRSSRARSANGCSPPAGRSGATASRSTTRLSPLGNSWCQWSAL